MAFTRIESPEARRLSHIGGSFAIIGIGLLVAGLMTIRVLAGHNYELKWAVALAMTSPAADAVAAGFMIAGLRRERAWRSAR